MRPTALPPDCLRCTNCSRCWLTLCHSAQPCQVMPYAEALQIKQPTASLPPFPVNLSGQCLASQKLVKHLKCPFSLHQPTPHCATLPPFPRQLVRPAPGRPRRRQAPQGPSLRALEDTTVCLPAFIKSHPIRLVPIPHPAPQASLLPAQIDILCLPAWPAVYCTANVSGGHLNPAVTFATCLTGHTSWGKGLLYAIAQVLGGVFGALFEVRALQRLLLRLWTCPHRLLAMPATCRLPER